MILYTLKSAEGYLEMA